MQKELRSAPFRWLSDGLVLLAAILIPSLLTLVYFVLMKGAGSVTNTIYLGSKIILILLPICWYRKLFGVWPRIPFLKKAGWKEGLTFGLLTFVLLGAIYWFWWKDSSLFAGVREMVNERLKGHAISETWQYLLLAFFIAIIHSALEEYYWRWFIFDRLCAIWPVLIAAIVSAFGFMLHHIIVLYAYANQETAWFMVPVCSLAVGAGGFVWAMIYSRYRSLLGCWIAHFFADLAIMLVGYHLCQGYFQ